MTSEEQAARLARALSRRLEISRRLARRTLTPTELDYARELVWNGRTLEAQRYILDCITRSTQ